MTRQNLVPRLAMLFFALLTILALTLTRLAKSIVTARYEIKAREANAAGEHSEDIQVRTDYAWAKAVVLRGEGDLEGARRAAAVA